MILATGVIYLSSIFGNHILGENDDFGESIVAVCAGIICDIYSSVFVCVHGKKNNVAVQYIAVVWQRIYGTLILFEILVVYTLAPSFLEIPAVYIIVFILLEMPVVYM